MRSSKQTAEEAPAVLMSAGWRVLAQSKQDPSPEGRHAAAVAALLLGKRRDAMQRLEVLASDRPKDEVVWSDLAAARYEVAVAENDAPLLAEALAAADRALLLNPTLPEALFNRAALIERLGLRDQAREAWEEYIARDRGSQWATEARGRIRTLEPLKDFNTILEGQFSRLASDPEATHALARSYPQEARTWGETWILWRWAAAKGRGDEFSAEQNLSVARELGLELRNVGGEGMLADAVDAVDRADVGQRQHLIAGQILLYDAQNDFKRDLAVSAQSKFEDAARELELGGSPLALLAEYYLAHTFHAVGRLPEARRREQHLISTAPPAYRALRAHLLWHLGLGYQSDGSWGQALQAFAESIRIFESLGEHGFAANVRGLVAEVYDRMGDPQSAWEQRVISLRGAGMRTTTRLQQALASVGRSAIIRKEPLVAVSFLDLAAAAAGRSERPVVQVEMLLLQARAHADLNDASAASDVIGRAHLVASTIEDETQREATKAEIMAAEGIVAKAPRDAIALLDRAIAYHRTRGRRILLPEMYLRRGRAFHEIGDWSQAATDFESGISEVEQNRESLPAGQSRWTVFRAAEELFDEAIALAIAGDDGESAFRLAERARARELLEKLGPGTPIDTLSIDRDVAVVEYVALPDRLILLAVDRSGVRFAEQKIKRADVEKEMNDFRAGIQENSSRFRQQAVSLHRLLIDPIASYVSGKETLVIVPGPSLAAMPFSALSDGTWFLTQRYSLIIAPSASVYARLASRKRRKREEWNVLVVANPIPEEGRESLPAAEREGADVTAVYGRSTFLRREGATVDAFLRHVRQADVVHIATHGAIGTGPRGDAALLLSGGRLDVSSIESLSLDRAAVVVVAACDSGRGRAQPEGTISVARAFLSAGASAVVATLWPVDDDASATFFPRLHRHLERGLSPARALREAQIESIRRGDSPELWSAVQSIGN
jgi:CHAT domain-containing protein